MKLDSRASPSQFLLRPLPAKGTYSWDGVTPLSIELMPAGHEPGDYQVLQSLYPRVLPSAGTAATTLSWMQAGALQSLPINFGSLTVLNLIGALRVISSSGEAPITFGVSTAGLTGSPLFVVMASAIRVGRFS